MKLLRIHLWRCRFIGAIPPRHPVLATSDSVIAIQLGEYYLGINSDSSFHHSMHDTFQQGIFHVALGINVSFDVCTTNEGNGNNIYFKVNIMLAKLLMAFNFCNKIFGGLVTFLSV